VTRAAWVLLAAALCSACVFRQTRQARIYVLDPMPAATPVDATPGAPGGVVGVLKVTVPGWIDRPQIARRSATGEIVTDEYARWGEPIARGIQRVLSENLAILLPDRRLVSAPFGPGIRADERVEVTVSEAAGQPDGTFLLEARWSVLGARGDALAQGRSSQRIRPSAPTASGWVAGANEALAALSREIAQAIRDLPPREPLG
jgi:uncharacterized protein